MDKGVSVFPQKAYVMENVAVPHWIGYFKQRVSKNKNFLGIITGEPGSGKTYASLSIGQQYDPKFNISQVVFSAKEFLDLLEACRCGHAMDGHKGKTEGNKKRCQSCDCDYFTPKLKKGSFILFDEAGIDLDSVRFQSTLQRMMKYVLETFRHRCYIVFFTTPYISFMMKSGRILINGYYQTAGIDYENKKVKLKPYLLQYNEWKEKTYKKYLRVITSKGIAPVKFWKVPLPSKELIELYELKKSEFTHNLNQSIKAEIAAIDKQKAGKVHFKHHCDYCNYDWESLKEKVPSCPSCSTKFGARIAQEKRGIEKEEIKKRIKEHKESKDIPSNNSEKPDVTDDNKVVFPFFE